MHPPAIALVPGFFGFEHRGDHTYFADRFVAGLRCVLEAIGVVGVPVVCVSTLGIASLHSRQGDLLRELRALETPLGGPRTWHILGHSTGGVDAALLLRDAPLVVQDGTTSYGTAGWGEWESLVHRVSSVVSIAAPHFGTGLASTPIGRFVSGHPSLGAARDFLRATLDLARRGDLESRAKFAMSAAPSVTKMPAFLLQMLLMNDLARDLHPEVLGALSSRPLRTEVLERAFSVVTVAPRPPEDHPDRLFFDLWKWTHDGSMTSSMYSPKSSPLNDAALKLPTQRDIAVPFEDEGDNDGVVTTHRQIFGTPLALVMCDHVDVLGRYRRTSLLDHKVIDPGLLTSGAEFGDDEFFALLVRIGTKLAEMVRSA